MQKLGKVEKSWSYATWTAPSHYNLLIGLMPHKSPKHVFASEYYKKEFFRFNERLGTDGHRVQVAGAAALPAAISEAEMGYRTHAMVSLPVLNPRTILNQGFDTLRADGQAQRHARDGEGR